MAKVIERVRLDDVYPLVDAHVADGWKPDADQAKAIRAMRNRLDALDEAE